MGVTSGWRIRYGSPSTMGWKSLLARTTQTADRGRDPHTVFPCSFFCGLGVELGLILVMVPRVRLEP